MITFRRLALVAAVLICAGCNPKARVEAARKAADTFHGLYNARDYPGMYRYSGPAVRSSSTEAAFVKYEEDVRAKLGDLKSADLVNYNLLYLLGGPQVRLDFHCQYADGPAVESFEINFKQNRPVIDGYRLDSPRLSGKS